MSYQKPLVKKIMFLVGQQSWWYDKKPVKGQEHHMK